MVLHCRTYEPQRRPSRALVRDMYTKSWSVFDRLIAILPPGGSIGYVTLRLPEAILILSIDSITSFSHSGICRTTHTCSSTGIKVTEFRDLCANPRYLLESQVLSLHIKYAKMFATGVLARLVFATLSGAAPHSVSISSIPPCTTMRPAPPIASTLGLAFDPYDSVPLPRHLLVTSAAANFPSVANLVCDVFNTPVFVPTPQIASSLRSRRGALACQSRRSVLRALGVGL
jgi:xylulokinase